MPQAKRTGRNRVTADLLVLFLNRANVDVDAMKEHANIGSKQLSVTLQRMMHRGLIKRVEKGVYTLTVKRRAA